jgi:AP-1 complex subunit beta-1
MAGNYEMCYIILSHIALLMKDGQHSNFYQYYKKFYVFCEEPFYIKKIKLDILVALCNTNNYNDILLEMEEYANDVNMKFVKYAIEAIGQVPMKVSESLDAVISLFKKFLARNADYVISETIIVLKSKSKFILINNNSFHIIFKT